VSETHTPIIDEPHFLFDLMDTLVVDPFYRAILEFLGTDLATWQSVRDYSTWVAFELGQIDYAGYCAGMFADRRSVDPVSLERAIRSGTRWVEGMPELLSRLPADRVHVLSNYPPWWRWIDEDLGISSRVGQLVVSCEIGVRKPDPGAFAIAAQRIGVAPGRVVFVDDREQNVEAAQRAGMTGILFTSARELELELRRRALVSW
jgi:putative hydrolase of the HAD superfamily